MKATNGAKVMGLGLCLFVLAFLVGMGDLVIEGELLHRVSFSVNTYAGLVSLLAIFVEVCGGVWTLVIDKDIFK